ncbi:glycosyltransferase family 4 protein [Cellulosimicrobium cellulans]|uniref:glycosyltransferase family 4 protein n=1 Tax=Cellulosimicrobium cellulans TaxID=1710 RepID=UPI00130E4201|nr:glycosyltransferase family 4 protein [Cellulosimicrobium cellulans]
MKVVVATSSVPFVQGGASLIVDWLAAAVAERGHEVEVFRFPFTTDPATMPAQLFGLRSLDFTDRCDRLVAVRTPSHLLRHPHKSVWFVHHHRPSYDLWDSARDVPDDADGREFRRMMFASDDAALAEANVFCNSEVMRRRLQQYNRVDAEVLYPPLDPAGGYAPAVAGDEIVYVSRVIDHKRQLLAVEALALTTTPVRLAIVGAFDDERSAYARRIREVVEANGLQDRVTVSGGWVSEQDKRAAVASSLATAYFPVDEDSYGYPSLEAAVMGRPVVTTTDSGGVVELVEHERNGLVVDPEPAALAQAFDRLWSDRALAGRLGAAQAGRVDELQISWDHVVERLLA